MKKFLLILIICPLLIISCLENYLIVNIKSPKRYDMEPKNNVYLNDEIIGKVVSVEKEKNEYIIKIAIDKKHEDKIVEESKFFLTKKDRKSIVVIEIENPNSAKLKNNAFVEAGNEVDLTVSKAFKFIKDKLTVFFNSSEWREFSKDLSSLFERIREEGKDNLDEIMPKINESIKNLSDNYREKHGDDFEKTIKPKIDSMLNELNKKIEQDN